MSAIDKAIKFMKDIAADDTHGYDQTNRWGKDYDCSSLIITAWENAGVKVKAAGATYTGNMKSVFLTCGFKDVTSTVNLSNCTGMKAGDVLLNVKNHTAMYLGSSKLVHASINENGKVVGGKTGDQTGKEICERSYYNYPWDCVLRYTDTNVSRETFNIQTLGTEPILTTPSAKAKATITGLCPAGYYTITQIKTVNGLTFGKLLSGAGWLLVDGFKRY